MAKKKVDAMQVQFDKAMKKIGAINSPKSLFIIDGELKEEFEANGTKYIIAAPDRCFNLNRQRAYHEIEIAFAMNQTPQSIKNRFVKAYNGIIRLMGAKGADWDAQMDTFLRDGINNVDSFKGTNTSRFPAAYYFCTLFIIAEKEDLSEWSFKMADKKIDDWTLENIRAADFLGLAQAFSVASLQTIKES